MCNSCQISLEIINGSPQKTYDNKVYFERFLYLFLSVCLYFAEESLECNHDLNSIIFSNQ